MARFKNLGDLIRRDRDLTKVAIIDLGGEEVPTEYTYLELDAMTAGDPAWAEAVMRVHVLSARPVLVGAAHDTERTAREL